MNRFSAISVLILSFFAACGMSLSAAIPAGERQALIAIYVHTNGDSWSNKTAWKTPPLDTDGFAMPGTEGTWYGVTVTADTVTTVGLQNNNLTGTLPAELGNLSGLENLYLQSNFLTGAIPAELGSLSNLKQLQLTHNQLTGSIPASFGSLDNLTYLSCFDNQLSGSIPPELGSMANLQYCSFAQNQLSGSIPAELGNASKMQIFNFSDNQLSGGIPVELCGLSQLQGLYLFNNRLSGSIPAEFGNLVNLLWLRLDCNMFRGAIPTTLANLTSLSVFYIGFNALYSNDPDLTAFLNSKQADWAASQTTAPANVTATGLNSTTIRLDWDASLYSGDPGGYRVFVGTAPGGPYEFYAQTADKTVTAMIVNGLAPLTAYYFVVSTRTDAHGAQQSTLDSDPSAEASAATYSMHSVTFVAGSGGTLSGETTQVVDHGSNCSPVTAEPEAIHHFVNWTGGVSSTDNPLTVTNVTSDMTVTANFAIDQHTVTFVEGAGGTISGDKVQAVDHGGSAAAVEAVAGTGYHFVDWTGGYAGTDNPLTVTDVTSDLTVTANFAINQYAVTFVEGANGAITGDKAQTVDHGGSTSEVTAVADTGYHFADWAGTGGFSSTDNPLTIGNVTQDMTITGNFAISNYTVSGTVTFGGSPLEGVTLNGLPGSPMTDSAGAYSAGITYGWSGTATPSHPYFTFTPPSATYANVASDQTTDYTAALIQSLVVSSPALGALWEKGKTYSITWLKQGTQNANVKILLYKGASTLVATIASKTANDGSHNWLVPATLAVGSTYFIKVQTIDNLVKDSSDKFSIIVPTITVTAPATGAVWVKNVVKTITWNKQGTQDANVKIQLFTGTTKKLDITLSAPNNGSCDWLIPTTLANGTYTIKVITLDGKVKGVSKVFSIAMGMIKVNSPATGAKWFRGMAYDIAWISEGAVNANVKIQLYKGTTLVSTISTSTPTAAGIFNWTVPVAQAVAATYAIKITGLDNKVSGKTGSFSIVPGIITVTAPAKGAVWQRGLPHLITWTRQGDLINANVKIHLYQGTTLVKTIAATTPNDGSHEWTIPAAQALAANYKVRVTTVDNLVQGNSGAFTISNNVGLTLTSPNGGENLQPVAIQPIRWTADPDVLEVKLEFSRDNGSSYATIADHAPNTGKYDWPVPVNFTANARIRVSDASGRPWIHEGILEYSLKFIYSGEGEEPGATLWFGGSDPQDPGYGFAKIAIGKNNLQFGGISKVIEPLAGNWHELRVRFDFRRDTAEIRLDEQLLFENAPLGTTRERYFQPNLVLQAGGEKALDFAMDDLAISVVRDSNAMEEPRRFLVLAEEFDRYDDKANALAGCWRLSAAGDKRNAVGLQVEGGQNKSLRLSAEPGRRLTIRLPFSLPENEPFDISDRCFNIVN